MQRKSFVEMARPYIRKLPFDTGPIKRGYHHLKVVQFKARYNIRRKLGGAGHADPETVYWIDPARVQWVTNLDAPADKTQARQRLERQLATQNFSERVFDRDRDKGKIVGGDWDKSDLVFKDLEIYLALEQRIRNGTPWQDTEFYKTVRDRVSDGELLWDCSSIQDLDARCEYLDQLISSIRDKGFQLNSDVLLPGEKAESGAKNPYLSSEVLVNVGRNGEYLFQDGRHRLAISQILGIENIPVKVLVRHEEWQAVREHLSAMLESKFGASKPGVLYQAPVHPDLKDFPATHQCEDRFETLRPFLENRSGNFLDVGASLGYFCHKAEDLGFDCYAIEVLPEVAWAARRIRDAEGKKFAIYEGDLWTALESELLRGKSFDTVNVLNILHHSLESKEKYEALIRFLKQLSVKQMFLETHKVDEFHMKGTYANMEPDEFVNFILKHTELTDYEHLGKAHDGRLMFRLFKSD